MEESVGRTFKILTVLSVHSMTLYAIKYCSGNLQKVYVKNKESNGMKSRRGKHESRKVVRDL